MSVPVLEAHMLQAAVIQEAYATMEWESLIHDLAARGVPQRKIALCAKVSQAKVSRLVAFKDRPPIGVAFNTEEGGLEELSKAAAARAEWKSRRDSLTCSLVADGMSQREVAPYARLNQATVSRWVAKRAASELN
ncbi:hypothetical protein [Amycolatopsis sp. cmx-8-4]|uniref:hypothetical protein n=1 Tax=Amycolatopsis sp. cmx-8-4 TaxID=2790947 RepID=UPI00397CCE90